jgi:CRISPR-associated protein Cmr1
MTEPHHILTAKYRVVTPMFLSGADQNHAELRLPSFKGALRFWWRALAAKHFGNDLQKLRDAEDMQFGSTRTGASRVRMRLSDKSIKTQEQTRFTRNSWQGYVGYGLIDKPGQTTRICIQPNSYFTVQLICSRCDDDQCRSLRKALVALGLFGGLGSRSRNGWGSITLESLSGVGEPWAAPTDEAALREKIDRLFATQAALQDWTAITWDSAYAIGKSHSDSEAAHHWLAQQYQSTIKEITDKPRREAFGLPRKHAGSNAGERRAGPILLHVHQAEGHPAIPLAVFLPGKFLEKQDEPAGGWQMSRDFVAHLEQA